MDNDDALDALVQQSALQPPPGFTQRVMHNLPLRPGPLERWSRWRWLLTATGLAGGATLGLAQLLSFVFGVWLAGAAL